jgi:hypothetical protein
VKLIYAIIDFVFLGEKQEIHEESIWAKVIESGIGLIKTVEDSKSQNKRKQVAYLQEPLMRKAFYHYFLNDNNDFEIFRLVSKEDDTSALGKAFEQTVAIHIFRKSVLANGKISLNELFVNAFKSEEYDVSKDLEEVKKDNNWKNILDWKLLPISTTNQLAERVSSDNVEESLVESNAELRQKRFVDWIEKWINYF